MKRFLIVAILIFTLCESCELKKDKEEYEKIIDSLTKEFVQMLVNRCMGM